MKYYWKYYLLESCKIQGLSVKHLLDVNRQLDITGDPIRMNLNHHICNKFC